MAWTITIGEGGSAYTISASALFDISCQPVPADNGTIDYVQWRLSIKGDLISGTASAVASSMVDLTDLANDQTAGKRVQIALDGTNQWDFSPTSTLNGPFVTRAASVESPGNGSSHWQYELDVEWKDLGNESVYELTVYTSVLSVNGKVTRKIWKASCKALTLATALSKVMTFKPSGSYVSEEIEKWKQEAKAAGTWIWEGQRTSAGILTIDCEVSYGPGGNVDYVEQPQAGSSKNPLLFERRRTVQEIRVLYLIRSFSPSITALPAHFAESPTLKRATGREKTQDKKIEDEKRGVYRRVFEEVWLNTGATTPQVNHNGHDVIVMATEPGDGAAGS